MQRILGARSEQSDLTRVRSGTDENALIARDAAELLYGHGPGGLLVTAAASASLVLMTPGVFARPGPMCWLIVMYLLLGVRVADLVTSRKRRARLDWDGSREIRRWSCAVTVTAALWAAFPLLFFHGLSAVERTTMAVIVSAMAGGSATVLGPVLPLAIGYCGALLLPTSFMFLLTPGSDNAFLGVLGIVFFFVMAAAAQVTHRATMSAIRLNRTNQTLIRETERERNRTEHANAELSTAHTALRETLETLEDRIKLRTIDLEHEIRERERYGRELARIASTDALTGLLNRGTLSERLARELERAECAHETIAVLFLDLDKFKEVNDVRGHLSGDHVLRELARRSSAIAPADAICARWGGDEFVFVLKRASAEWAHAFGVELRRQVGEPLMIGSDTVHIDATIGIAVFPDHGTTPDDLIRAADMAMYAGKHEGRGHVRLFDPGLADELRTRHLLGQALREAMSGAELRLEYQPIVAADDRRCTSLEALLRWNHPERGAIAPSEFVPLAERSGDIIAIGRWVLMEACSAAAGWPGDPPPNVSVNVSVAQILAGSLVDDVREALVRTGLDARRLHVEVTETLFASDHAQVVPTLVALRAMGVRISLDDFGTGFSSLGFLRSLPIDIIKIDKSFVGTIDGESEPIIRAIRSLCRALHIEIVAEGVETAKQAALLSSMDVGLLQGYWFSRPLSADAVYGWLIDTGSVSTPRMSGVLTSAPG